MDVILLLILLALPVYLVCWWLGRKLIKPELKRKLVTWAATIIITPLLYICGILIWLSWMEYYPNHDFDSHAWKADQEIRYEFSKHLINSKLLIGKSKEEVIAILGKEENALKNNEWSYELGYRPGFFNIDPDRLEIKFLNNRVKEVYQVFR